MEIRIMSSNIWGNCPADCPIANRDDLLVSVYRKYAPLVIGLQECSPKSRGEKDNIISMCAPEYIELDPSPKNVNNFTPILYSRRLTLLDSGWELFYGLNDWDSKSITWGRFALDGKEFVAVNVHFFYTDDFAGEQARKSNANQLLRLIGRFGALPVIITGDFNCEERTFALQALMNSGLSLASRINPQNPCSHHFKPKYDSAGGLFSGGTLEGGREDSIDHIFLKNASAKAYTVITDQDALDASDHCPVFADVEI